jgi:hypothetical protein
MADFGNNQRSRSRPWYYRRWGALLLSPLGVVLVSAGRLLIISNYNATTATTVASSTGYVNTILGSIIPLVPVFVPYVALLLLLLRQFTLSALTFAFSAFIAPTSLTLPISRSLAAEDTYQVLDRINANRPITLVIALVIVIIAYGYFHSWVEALATVLLLTVAVALLSAPIIRDLYLPSSLQSANSSERAIGTSFRHDANESLPSVEHYITLVAISGLVVIAIIIIITAYAGAVTDFIFGLTNFVSKVIALVLRAIPDVATLVIAVVTTIAFFPYVYSIYPVPHRTEYYAGILRSPWLPAEKLSLRGGRNYYGYTLAGDQDWFTVLLARTRKIVYIHTDDILSRSAYETLSQRKIPVEPPLVTTFYRKPATIRPCADRKYLLRSGVSATRTRSSGKAPTVPHGHLLPGTRPFG